MTVFFRGIAKPKDKPLNSKAQRRDREPSGEGARPPGMAVHEHQTGGSCTMRLIVSIAALAILVSPALADRQVTEDERAKLAAAVQTEGCTGGKFEKDGRRPAV